MDANMCIAVTRTPPLTNVRVRVARAGETRLRRAGEKHEPAVAKTTSQRRPCGVPMVLLGAPCRNVPRCLVVSCGVPWRGSAPCYAMQ
eukprot:2774377-Pyramimonas_sp.AAC.1